MWFNQVHSYPTPSLSDIISWQKRIFFGPNISRSGRNRSMPFPEGLVLNEHMQALLRRFHFLSVIVLSFFFIVVFLLYLFTCIIVSLLALLRLVVISFSLHYICRLLLSIQSAISITDADVLPPFWSRVLTPTQ